jgi:hypothetical protein
VAEEGRTALAARCMVGVAGSSQWLWVVYEVCDSTAAASTSASCDADPWRRAVSFDMHRKELATVVELTLGGKQLDELPFSTSRKLLCSSEVVLFAARRSHPVHRTVGGGATGHLVFEGKFGGESSWQCVEREGTPWFR